jgi:hypothetical protein
MERRELMKSRLKILLVCFSIIAGLSLSGCNTNITDSALVTASLEPTYAVVTDKQPIVAVSNKSENNVPKSEKSGDQATVASNIVQQTLPADSSKTFSDKQPKIMGLAIGEQQEKAVKQYGQPLKSYIMEDPTDPISVYQYKGFSVGFNTANEIQFIDVNSREVNPDLNGLRLGDTAAKALEALGKPDKNTSYVISYYTKTAILKLDIDPKTKTIQSIKLFAVNES